MQADTPAVPVPEPDGDWIPRRQLQRGLWISILSSTMGMPWVVVALGMPTTMLMECLGGSALAVGMIVTIQQLSTVAQLPSALAGEKLAYRKKFWFFTALIHRLLWLVPVLLVLLPNPRVSGVRILLLLAIAVSSLLSQVSAPLWFSWMGDLIPDRLRARFWGKRQSVVMIAHLVATVLVGRVLDIFPDPRSEGGGFLGFIIVFGVGTICGSADVIIHNFVPEPRQAPPAAPQPWLRRCLEPLRDPDFKWLTLALGGWMFSIGLVGSFGILYLTRKFGVSYTALSVTMISASLGTAVAGMLWGSLMELAGTRTTGAIAMLLAPAMGFCWFIMSPETVAMPIPWIGVVAVPQPVVLLTIVNFFSGVLYSGVGLAQVNLISAITQRQGRTVSMAVHWTSVGALGATGPLIGGAITDWLEAHPVGWIMPGGTEFGFMHALILLQVALVWLFCLPALLRVRPCGRDLPLPLLAGNPLRAAGLLSGLASLTRAAAPAQRVRALRRLGRDGDTNVVAELAAQLDDPHADVREAAVVALGDIGTDCAVDVLATRLDDHEEDLAPQVARALRTASHPGGVDALVRRLGTPDRETQAESARALGAIGDQRAVGSLKELLKTSVDEKVVTASGEALAQLGDFEAVYDILPRMRGARRSVLRRSLAVAVGDLIGQPSEFYTVLVREEKDRGYAVAQLFRKLHRKVRRTTPSRDIRTRLEGLVDDLADAYERDEIGACCGVLRSLGMELAQLLYGFDTHADIRVATSRLIHRAPRAGVALWYLFDLEEQLAAEGDQIDYVDVLLGIYVLSGIPEGSK